jgi:hypothetical protein
MDRKLISPILRSMLKKNYSEIFREMLEYFHNNYMSNDMLVDFLKFVQIKDSIEKCYQTSGETDIKVSQLRTKIWNKHGSFFDSIGYLYRTATSRILHRLYNLFIMFFRYKKLQQKKGDVPDAEEFRQEWESILNACVKNTGIELYELVGNFLEEARPNRDLGSDFEEFKNYYKVHHNDLLPNAKNRYEIRMRREDRGTNDYSSFNYGWNRPWLYNITIDDILQVANIQKRKTSLEKKSGSGKKSGSKMSSESVLSKLKKKSKKRTSKPKKPVICYF